MTYYESKIRLNELLTPEFLNQLSEVVKLCAYDFDSHELCDFLEDLHIRAGLEFNDFKPYDFD